MAALTLDASAALRVVLESGRQSATIDLLAAVAAVYAPSLFVAKPRMRCGSMSASGISPRRARGAPAPRC
jgi:hypothetical protein